MTRILAVSDSPNAIGTRWLCAHDDIDYTDQIVKIGAIAFVGIFFKIDPSSRVRIASG